MTTLYRTLYSILFIGLVGCNLAPVQTTTATPQTIVMAQVATTVPTVSRTLQPLPSQTSEPSQTPTAQSACAPLDDVQRHIRYTITADVDYPLHSVVVEQHIDYTNVSGESLNDIVLNIEPNNFSGAFQLQSVLVDGESPVFNVDTRRMTITLPEPLEPGCAFRLSLTFNLYPPPIGGGITSYRGFFGFTERQINLGHWTPTVAARINREWITRRIVFVGEQVVLEPADWDVTIHVEGVDQIVIAAPGTATQLETTSWHFEHLNSRDFSLSMSESYEIRRQRAESGVVVEMYHFGDTLVFVNEGYVDTAAHSLEVATRSLEMYEDLFGTYPYERLLIVQGDFPDGMEFSGLVFVSTSWFRNYPGSPAAYLTFITVHEVSHQWWYARVGNDPAQYPWLDEALATYSEYIFYEEFYPDLSEWWWMFRVENYEPQGFVDGTVYDFVNVREYINAIYLRGVLMLHEIREEIGTEAFFALLRRYVETGDGQLATPALFWSVMTQEEFDATTEIRSRYLRQDVIRTGGASSGG